MTKVEELAATLKKLNEEYQFACASDPVAAARINGEIRRTMQHYNRLKQQQFKKTYKYSPASV